MQKQDNNTQLETTAYVPAKKSLTAEFWVGLFFLAGLLSLSYLAFNLGNIKLTNSGFYQIVTEFDNISGLNVGASVEIAGVSIGEVSQINLKDISAEVVLQIKDGIELRDDDIAAIRTKGIIGDRYVKIIPGGSEDHLQDGDSIIDTESIVDLEDIISEFIHSMDNSPPSESITNENSRFENGAPE